MNSLRGVNAGLVSLLVVSGLLVCVLFWLGGDARSQLLARNTFLLASAASGISIPIGVLLALLVFRTDMPARRVAAALLAVMLFMPLYLQAAAWDAGFGQLGWYTLASERLTAPWLDGWRAAIWVHGLAGVPWVAFIVAAGLRFVEPELEEDALLHGSLRQVVARVTMPRAAAHVAVAFLWVWVTTAGEMTVTDLYLVRTYAEELYTGFALGDDLQQAWLTALPGILLVAWLTLAAMLLVSWFMTPAAPGVAASRRRFWLRRWRWPACLLAMSIILLLAAVPLANLCWKAGGTVQQVGGQPLRHWSWALFLEVVGSSPWRFRRELAWTWLIAGVAATLAVSVATPLAWWARRGGWPSLPALLTSAVCLTWPAPLVGLSVIWLLNRESALLIWLYDRTITAPVLALLIRCLPLPVLVLWFSFRSLSPEVLESAALAGAGALRRFLWVALPQRVSAVGIAWLVALAVGMGDLAATILVVPPGVTTVSIRVFGLIHAGVRHQEAGLCLTSTVGFVGLAVAAILLYRGQRKLHSGIWTDGL